MAKDWNSKSDTTLRDLGEKMSRESLEKVKMNLENKLPFGPEDIKMVCDLWRETSMEVVPLEALKRRWEFLKNAIIKELSENSLYTSEDEWDEGRKFGLEIGLSLALAKGETCIGSLLKEKEAEE